MSRKREVRRSHSSSDAAQFTNEAILPGIVDTTADLTDMRKADPREWVPPERAAAAMELFCSDGAAPTIRNHSHDGRRTAKT
jgi:hypothetical protein